MGIDNSISTRSSIKASDYLARFFQEKGVRYIFELIGGMTAHIIDSLANNGSFELVSMHHEQSAAFAAEGWARMSGMPGIAIASSGPGAANLLTGIGSCYFDSVPAIFITGQVNRHELKENRQVRQLGFQEMDIVSMAKPVTKMALQVDSPESLPAILERAWEVAISGRPGPVLLDIPMDVQRTPIKPVAVDSKNSASTLPPTMNGSIALLVEKMAQAERPLILAGGGIRIGCVHAEFMRFVQSAGIPVVHSLQGTDLLPYEHKSRVGMIGTYGNRWANCALDEADFVLVLGSRLDIRQTGAETESFVSSKYICHVDIDPGEINNRIPAQLPINMALNDFFDAVAKFEGLLKARNCQAWFDRIQTFRAKYPDIDENSGIGQVNPNLCVHRVTRASQDHAAVVAVDVGQHQMWVSQSAELSDGQRFLNSGGMGAMGFALPVAIGAYCFTRKPIVFFAGDGGFQINIQELETIAHHSLPIKMIVLNNHHLGMIRQFQDEYFGGRFPSSMRGYSCPDFVAVANAYGIEGYRVNSEEELDKATALMWADPGSPFILDVRVDSKANAFPKMEFGQPLSRMAPQLSR